MGWKAHPASLEATFLDRYGARLFLYVTNFYLALHLVTPEMPALSAGGFRTALEGVGGVLTAALGLHIVILLNIALFAPLFSFRAVLWALVQVAAIMVAFVSCALRDGVDGPVILLALLRWLP